MALDMAVFVGRDVMYVRRDDEGDDSDKRGFKKISKRYEQRDLDSEHERATFVSNTERSSLDLFGASDALPPLLIKRVTELEGQVFNCGAAFLHDALYVQSLIFNLQKMEFF